MAKADITIIRGDSTTVTLTPMCGDECIELSDEDVLRVMVFDGDGNVILEKSMTGDEQDPETKGIPLAFTPDDTCFPDITTDTVFMWEGEIVFSDGRVLTPWHRRSLAVLTDRITPLMRGGGNTDKQS